MCSLYIIQSFRKWAWKQYWLFFLPESIKPLKKGYFQDFIENNDFVVWVLSDETFLCNSLFIKAIFKKIMTQKGIGVKFDCNDFLLGQKARSSHLVLWSQRISIVEDTLKTRCRRKQAHENYDHFSHLNRCGIRSLSPFFYSMSVFACINLGQGINFIKGIILFLSLNFKMFYLICLLRSGIYREGEAEEKEN